MPRPSIPVILARRHTRHVLSAAVRLSALTILAACGDDVHTKGDGAAGSMDSSVSLSVSSSAPAAAPALAAPPIARDAALGIAGSARVESSESVGSSESSESSRTQRVAEQSASATAQPPAPESVSPHSASTQSTSAIAAAAQSMVIRSGWANVEVDSLSRAISAVQRITTALGGYVGNTSIMTGEDQVRRASIELKIPVSRYEEAVSGLGPLGTVESVNSSAQDVGEEFTDLTARIANARRLESRLVILLAERTGRLQDALMVERELARVREEIERYEGRTRFLAARVAMSTLVVNLHERIPIVSANPGENVLVEAAKDAWRNLVGVIALIIQSLGVIIPIGGLVALGYAIYRRRRISSVA